MWTLWGFPSMQLSPLCGFPNACFTLSGRHVFQQVLYLCTTSHVEWQFTTYNYVSQVCSFTCADPVELQHLGLFHKVFFFFPTSHFTDFLCWLLDVWEFSTQFLSLFFLLCFFLCFTSMFAADPDLTCFLPTGLQFGELWKRIWPSFGSCSLHSS